MTFGQIRFIKWFLLAVFIGCAGFVGSFVLEGMRVRRTPGAGLVVEPADPTSREVELEQLDSEGRTAWTLKAAESVAHPESGQQFKDVEIKFRAGDGDSPVTVTADRCNIGANNSVHLEGNVVVVDETTVRLEAETLEFRRFPDRVWSEDPVRYSKQGLQGTADAMLYTIQRGELDLDGNVSMILQPDGDAPVTVTSRLARLRRNRRWVGYIDDVRVRQSRRTLHANDLQLFFDESEQFITRVEAYEKVDLRLHVGEAADPGSGTAAKDNGRVAGEALTSEPGLKRLTTDRLEMLFRDGGKELELVRALDGGTLSLVPPDGASSGSHKTLTGNLLAFEFDEAGALTHLRGRGGVELVLTPIGVDSSESKTVRARQIESDFDPSSGELIEARCERSVEFEQGSVHATSDYGVFRGPESLLVLTQSPRLWDTRTSLTAETIELDVAGGDVTGIGDVRTSSLSGAAGAGLFSAGAGKDEPVHFVSARLDYDRAADVAVYTGDARGFRGPNRIEAATLRILQESGDLVAEGDVRTVFLQPLVASSEDAKGSPNVTRAGALRYRADGEVLEYSDDVQMRAKELTLSGERIDVTLQAGGGGVREIDARGKVAIETPDGKASGDSAKYLPEDQSMTVSGERASLEKAGKVTEGKQLTFFLSDDRILVDGREQRRTKTTYISKPRSP